MGVAEDVKVEKSGCSNRRDAEEGKRDANRGRLDKLIMEEIGKVEKVLYEEAVNYRDTITANRKADFFPSGVSSL